MYYLQNKKIIFLKIAQKTNVQIALLISQYYSYQLKYNKIQDLKCLKCPKEPLSQLCCNSNNSTHGWNITGEAWNFICKKCDRVYIVCPKCSGQNFITENTYGNCYYNFYDCNFSYQWHKDPDKYYSCKCINHTVKNITDQVNNLYLMKFLGFYATRNEYCFNSTDEKMLHSYCTDYDIHNYEMIEPVEKDEFAKNKNEIINWYVGNKNKFWYHNSEIPNDSNITGDDGGFLHYWKCYNCHQQFSLTDK